MGGGEEESLRNPCIWRSLASLVSDFVFTSGVDSRGLRWLREMTRVRQGPRQQIYPMRNATPEFHLHFALSGPPSINFVLTVQLCPSGRRNFGDQKMLVAIFIWFSRGTKVVGSELFLCERKGIEELNQKSLWKILVKQVVLMIKGLQVAERELGRLLSALRWTLELFPHSPYSAYLPHCANRCIPSTHLAA